MSRSLQEIKDEVAQKIAEAVDVETLDAIRVSVLGKKGELTQILKGMKDLSPEERPKVGQQVNEVRKVLEDKIAEQMASLKDKLLQDKMKRETIDVTLPGTRAIRGHKHPNQVAREALEKVFIGMGYEIVDGPEVEYDKYNFEMLNIPANHPAKDEQDTFYIKRNPEDTENDILLRTQTSSVQARIMEGGKLPIKILSPGRVFRADEVDATHSPSFHQVEGLVVGKDVTMADLKGTLDQFAREFFGPGTKTKLRPHHFPFTEPSAEVDVTCFKCHGKGCGVCKGSGWIEILGCGMVHPHVLEMCGIDPNEYSGFAFGIGLERVALLKYEIDDMRLLYENDVRFLSQF
ncbi:MAG: phenylalanine--tRNA ligase subunit alpha [Lachnospiraceae bacterium]|nr:phenylalanine--tRNA ligase subunit alpha [Lachnospiraceae bacterium]